MKPLFAMLARYNHWANVRLYDACAALPDGDYRADLGAFFGSLHGTLNHLVVADLIWLNRFTGEGAAPTRLDTILADDFASLRTLREATDTRLLTFVDTRTDADLLGTFSYQRITTPDVVTQPLAPALLHTFNHQTHHRGQCHALLTRVAGKAPSFDLVNYQRETGYSA